MMKNAANTTMSDPRNKIDCSKCHNEKCALAGKEFNMAVCTGYKSLWFDSIEKDVNDIKVVSE